MLYIKTIFLFLIFIAGASALGYKLIKSFKLLKVLSREEEIIFSFALGMGVLSFLIFFLGLMGILYLRWVILIFGLLVLASSRSALQLFKNIFSLFYEFRSLFNNKSRLQRLIICLVFLSIIFTFIGSLAPAKGNDALVYHLSDAKYFAQHHKVSFIPYTSRSIWPYFMQMFFTLAMLFNNPLMAKLFHFCMYLFGGMAVYSFGRRFVNKEAAFFAASVFLLTPGIFTQATYAYIDLGWTFYAFLGFYAFMLWDFKQEKRWLIISALMCGIAADTKYIGLTSPFIIALMLVIIGFFYKKEKLLLLKSFALFSLAAGVIILPYYLRPYLYTGNPLYPFYFRFIAEGGWYRPDMGFGMVKCPLNLIISPWFMTYFPGEIFGGAESQVGPLYLGLLPGLVFLKKPNKHISAVIIFTGLFYFFWFFGFQAVRYLMPAIPFMAILIGYIIFSIYEKDKKLGGFIKSVLALFLIFNFALCIYYNTEEITFFIGRDADASTYLTTHDRSSGIFQYINKNTPAGSRVLLINEIRTFYLDRDNMREDHYRLYDNYHLKGVKDIIKDLKDKGITHIVYAEGQRHKIDGKESGNSLKVLTNDKGFRQKYLEELVTLEYDKDASQATTYRLYRLK